MKPKIPNPPYVEDLAAARRELALLQQQRAELEGKIAWKQAQIAKLQRLTQPAGDADVSLAQVITAVNRSGGVTYGISDSCRRVMRASERPLRANEVVLILEHCGFLISRYVDPLSAVTTVLRRLAARGELHVVGVTEGGWPSYAWSGSQNHPAGSGESGAAIEKKIPKASRSPSGTHRRSDSKVKTTARNEIEKVNRNEDQENIHE